MPIKYLFPPREDRLLPILVIGIFVTPIYLFTADYAIIAAAFVAQGVFLGANYGQNPSYLSERFPTEVRATAAGFCYRQGAIWAGLVAPVMAAFAAGQPDGFAMPTLVGTVGAALIFVASLLCGPETKGKILVWDITLPAEAS